MEVNSTIPEKKIIEIDPKHRELINKRIIDLKTKLLDFSRRNPLVSANLNDRSNASLRFVDEILERLFQDLLTKEKMEFVSLPSLEEVPKDEESDIFQNKFIELRNSDRDFILNMDQIDYSKDNAHEEEVKAIRILKDKVRNLLGFPKRQTSRNISLSEHALSHGVNPGFELPTENDNHEDGRHEDDKIQTLLLPDRLERKLTALMQKEKTWSDETGISVLKIAFGYLEWKDNPDSKEIYSPLVLVPVVINKYKSANGVKFLVSYSGNNECDLDFNTVLVEKLKREFGIDLPVYEPGSSIEEYLQSINNLNITNMHWKVRRWVSLGVFPSVRISMYKDLSEWDFASHPIVSQMLIGSENKSGVLPFGDEYSIDEPEFEANLAFNDVIADIDSSQFSTILDISQGKNLAVEGPPGSGKSQTIINTIAAMMAKGKKILFVAEKSAALEVVRSRLEAKGLGEFVLPLQASRSSKEDVKSSIRERLNATSKKNPANYQLKVVEFKKYRDQLKEYIIVLTTPYNNSGYSIHEVLGANIKYRKYYDELPYEVKESYNENILGLNKEGISELHSSCQQIQKLVDDIDNFNSVWNKVDCTNLDPFTIEHIRSFLHDTINNLKQIIYLKEKLTDFNIGFDISHHRIEALINHLGYVPDNLSEEQRLILGRLKEDTAKNIFFDFYRSLIKFSSQSSELNGFCNYLDVQQLLNELNTLLSCFDFFDLSKIDIHSVDERTTNFKLRSEFLISFSNYVEKINFDFPNLMNSSLISLSFGLKISSGINSDLLFKRHHKWLDIINRQEVSSFAKKIEQYYLLEKDCLRSKLGSQGLSFDEIEFLLHFTNTNCLGKNLGSDYRGFPLQKINDTSLMLKNQLLSLKKTRDFINSIYLNYPDLQEINIVQLIKGLQFVARIPVSIIERKDLKLKGTEVKALLQRLQTDAELLKSSRDNLNAQFYLSEDITFEKLKNLHNQFDNSTFLSFLISKDYRNACKFFNSISKDKKVEKSVKRKRILDLMNYYKNLESFTKNSLQDLLGDSYWGIDTDFDLLLQVNKFFSDIDLSMSSGINSSILREYLYTIPYDDYLILASDKQMFDKAIQLNCESFSSLEKRIEETNNDAASLERFNSLLTGIEPETLLSDLEDELTLFHKKYQLKNKIDQNENIKNLLGLDFKGVCTDLNIYKVLCDFYSGIQNLSNFTDSNEIRELFLTASVEDVLKFMKIAMPQSYDFQPDSSASISDILSTPLKDIQGKICEYKDKFEQAESYSRFINVFIDSLHDKNILTLETVSYYKDVASDNISLQELISNNPLVKTLLMDVFKGKETDIGMIQPIKDYVEYLDNSDVDEKGPLLEVVINDKKTEFSNLIFSIKHEQNLFLEKIDRLSGFMKYDISYMKDSTDKGNLDLIESLLNDFHLLSIVSKVNSKLDHLIDKGFSVYRNYLKNNLNQKNIADKFMSLIMSIFARDIYKDQNIKSILEQCHGTYLNHARNQIKELDREILLLTSQKIRNQLIRNANPPLGKGKGKKSEYTQMSLLSHEVEKRKRLLSPRELLRRAGEAMIAIKPCWMMSPLAVSQYLPKGLIEFDLLIIDEASQMTPEDAIGALVRSKQVMIVGDTNQLPPTQFFSKFLDDSEEDDDHKVLEESILEIANNCFRPARRLRWHYRSRHSSLIAFSNKYIYGNDLVVFPNPREDSDSLGVCIKKVDGVYSNSINDIEASEMVDEIIKFMQNNRGLSLGVVVVNQKQKELIQDKLNFAIESSKKAQEYLEKWEVFNEGLESFFIKNLENVQGDERDVIYIGTVYGPESQGGKVMQRFGPISGTAGKRRLNVLFSRAKKRILTFTSMNPSDIKADESGNVGAYLLKKWIEYSHTGILESGSVDENKEPDSDFEVHVMEQIRSLGFEVEPQVGVQGYFIDIGVKHPELGYFMLGVECDGATYHSSKSARDRDRLRQEVLEGLGWKLHRIWSIDWFTDPRRETEKLREVIESLI